MGPGRADERLVDEIDGYLDAVPRALSRTEDIGSFTLFVSTAAWPYYARPRRGLAGPLDAADVRAVLTRQAQLGVPRTFEWVVDRTPSMVGVARDAGLAVTLYPLLVLDTVAGVPAPVPEGVRVGLLGPDDPALPAALAVQHLGFASPGTAVGDVGAAERDTSAVTRDLATVQGNIRAGRSVVVAASDDDGPLCVGMHQPVGRATEIVGVATLPAARRRGLGAAVTAALVADARTRGATLIFLSAGSDDVARVYEGVGFRRVGQAGAAEPPPDGGAS